MSRRFAARAWQAADKAKLEKTPRCGVFGGAMDLIMREGIKPGRVRGYKGGPRSSSALCASYPDRPSRTCTCGRDMMRDWLAAERLQQICAIATAYQPFFT